MKPEINTLAAARGVTVAARQKWKERGAVPHRWRITLLGDAAARGLPLTVVDMEWQPSVKAPQSGAEAA